MSAPRRLGWHSLGTSFDCPCGETHAIPIHECYVGDDAAKQLAKYARDHCGATALIVSDANTRQAGGDAVLQALTGTGKTVHEKTFGPDALDATDTLGDEVAQAGENADFFVAVGSGTISDLAKYAGHKLDRPVLLFPTAASMNGYTSAIVALKIRGLKRTLPCTPATGVYADPAVAATAPRRMTAAGVGDFLSKCSSSSDWRAAHLLRGGYFCDRPREFFEGTQEELLCAAQRVGRGETEAVGTILKALILSGLSMVVAGSSAPASGGEHLISHYLDMKQALFGTPHDLHGIQVGVATVYTLGLWERVLELDPESVDPDALADAHPTDEEIMGRIEDDWGPVAEEVKAQWREKSLDKKGLRAEIQKFRAEFPALHAWVRRDFLKPEIVAKAIRGAGGPVDPEGLNAPIDEYRNAQRYARYLRNRFTILDLAAELGIT